MVYIYFYLSQVLTMFFLLIINNLNQLFLALCDKLDKYDVSILK